jgi:pyruvate/2-oxoacid:ferredoxin oxidoreductase alpha subunit
MNAFTIITNRLFEKVFRREEETVLFGEPCTIDPLTAVAIVESKHVGSTAFCGPLPESITKETFSSTTDNETNLQEVHTALLSPNPRSAFASAMGLALTGERATVFLTATDLHACQDLLIECVKQHLPIIIHVALCDHCQNVTYDAYLASSNTGCMQFLASTTQDAVDYTMFARQVAEESLIPAIVAVDTFKPTTAELPSEELSTAWFGLPNAFIACPNDAQRLIFGEQRRRVPDRWNLERPLLLSPIHKHSSATFGATRAPFYDSQLPDILEQSQTTWEKLSGRTFSSIQQTKVVDAATLYLCQGAMYNIASGVDNLKVVSVNCMRPFPTEALCHAASNCKQVIVLDTTSVTLCGDSQFATEIKAALASLQCTISVVRCLDAQEEDIAALDTVANEGGTIPAMLGVSFIQDNTPYPKQTSALQEIARAYPDIASHSLASKKEVTHDQSQQVSKSPLLDSNVWQDTYGNLPQFWDQIGTLYNDGNELLLTASPLLSANSVPPLTAALRNVNSNTLVLPVFEPMHCDGDPCLWMSCPDGSVSAIVLGPKTLLDSGIAKAGGASSGLRSISSALCKQMVAVAKSNMQPTLGELLALAFEELDVAEDRKVSLTEGLEAVVDAVGTIPIAKTPTFFDKDGANEFLILCVDPDACKSTELIISSCSGHGIEPTARTDVSVQRARELRDLILELPDTSGETIHRIAQIDGMKLPAIMLSRHCHHAMAAGDESEVGSGAKLVLRQALALAEYALQPHLQELLTEIDGLKDSLQSGATSLLVDAIPSSNLDAIAKAIEQIGQDEVDLATVLTSMQGAEDAPTVDGETVRVMASFVSELNHIAHRLTHSSGGLGRARTGLTISGNATGNWAAMFPWNPFSTPVAVNTTHTGCSMSVGLFEGQMQRVLTDLNTIRKAKLVLENPIKAAHPEQEIDANSLEELTKEERALCPPLIIVADAASMHRNSLSELAWILDSDLPIKVLVFGDGTEDVALFGLTSCSAFIAQCSPSNPDHFASSVIGALQYKGPALVSVYAPSPKQHGFAVEDLMTQATLAVDCRVCPLFTYNPSDEGVFGTCIDITANPNFTSLLVSEELTPSKWAASQQRFNDGFAGDEVILARWKMLQELSGVVTPFDDVARAEQDEAACQHTLDLEALARDYQAKMATLREQYHAEAVASVTSGLMQMASQASTKEDAT